jgi:hypothetical protein
MRSRTSRRVLLAVLALALAVAGAITAAVAFSAPAKPGITLQIAPASQSITRGQSASFTVTVTPSGGFTGAVTLTVSGVPSNLVTLSPNPVQMTSTTAKTSTLTFATTSGTATGTYPFTVTGASGKVSGSVSGSVTVNYPLSGALTMTATPASVSMSPGASAVYSLQLTRTNLSGPVTFGLAGTAPAGATATFTPNPTTGNSATLQLATTSSISAGSYSLNIVAGGTDGTGTKRYAYATATLVITTSGKAFSISGNLSDLLAPGVGRPLNLTLTNPNNQAIAVNNLTVTIKSVSKASTAPAGSCTTADYAITQYSGPYPLSVPANGSATLSGLAPQSKWPFVRMLNTAANQDGCKGATLTLAYSGSGSGS